MLIKDKALVKDKRKGKGKAMKLKDKWKNKVLAVSTLEPKVLQT